MMHPEIRRILKRLLIAQESEDSAWETMMRDPPGGREESARALSGASGVKTYIVRELLSAVRIFEPAPVAPLDECSICRGRHGREVEHACE